MRFRIKYEMTICKESINSVDELITQAQTGNIAAYETLINQYQKTVYNFAYRLTNNQSDANDLAQDVFIKIFQALPKFRQQCSFSTWLYRIVYNTFLDEQKRTYYKNRSREVPLDEHLSVSSQTEPSTSYSEKNEQENLSQQVMSAVNQLPPEFRIIVTLYHIQGLSYKEIADITKVSIGTVMSRLSRSKEKLKKIILDSGINIE